MDDLAEEQAAWTGTYMDGHVDKAVSWSKETHNVEFITLNSENTAKWNSALLPITEKWIKNADSKGLPGKDIVDSISGFVANH